jgi:hypothetical protein
MKKYMQWVVVPALLVAFTLPQGAQAATYYYQTPAQQQQIAYLYAVIAQLQAQLNALNASQSTAASNDASVETVGVADAYGDAVEFTGKVTFTHSGSVSVWFEYGLTTALNYSTVAQTISNRSTGSVATFTTTAPDLNISQTYYYRAVAKGSDGRYSEGAIKSFRYSGNGYSSNSSNSYSHSSSYSTPDVTTNSASYVTTDSADLAGRVDMNDYENGIAFVVYGEDESMINDVDRENRYSDITTSGHDLRKVSVNSNLDSDRSFTTSVYSLNDDTKYYYRYCVEYDDRDDGQTLVCGDVEHFYTDRN